MRICRENPDLVKIGLQYRALHVRTQGRFVVTGELNRHKSAAFKWNGLKLLVRLYACISAAPIGWNSVIFDIGDFL